MSSRELIVLGSASQVPTRHRNHNAYFLRWDEEGILFDPGEGTQRQMLYAGLSSRQVTRICITHFHGDHALGLPGIIQRLSLDSAPHPVEVYYPASGQAFYERLRHATVFMDKATIVPRPIAKDGVVAKTKGFELSAARLEHSVDTFGFRLEEPARVQLIPSRLAEHGLSGPRVGELQRRGVVEVGGRTVRLEDVGEKREGQSFAFIMDTRPCANAGRLARGVDLLVCESTYLDSEREEAHSHFHMTARQAAELAHEAGARRLVLTHFSQRYEDTAPFVQEAQALVPDVVAVRDLDHVEVPKRVRAA
ncbi:ribonuclease Z [Archangium gephyra]|uniref:Ribonuclease Z n=1 Tax=Archangium gephyra TaxID=48 RepID=A0AAC8Q077_9BACT|nr:ribonuclease Z [Archangium gephyra]AKI98639.1 Ribonuclease Z [Archangium gephyra]REG30571.1 ribonuclease Z [Archangium gephyra]